MLQEVHRTGPIPSGVRSSDVWRLPLAVAAALLLHGAMLLVLSTQWPEPIGAGGQLLEAISVEIVSASAVESAATEKAEAGASERLADSTAEPQSQAASETAAAAEREVVTKTVEHAEKVETTSQAEPVPATLARAAEPEVAPAAEATLPPPTPPVVPSAPQPVEAPTPARIAAAAATAATSARGDADAERAASAAARPTPGAIAAFAREVASALGRAKPRSTGQRGTVHIAFVVGPTGGLEEARVARSSGHGRLDDAAIDAVRRARLPRPPAGLSAVERTFSQPYDFH